MAHNASHCLVCVTKSSYSKNMKIMFQAQIRSKTILGLVKKEYIVLCTSLGRLLGVGGAQEACPGLLWSTNIYKMGRSMDSQWCRRHSHFQTINKWVKLVIWRLCYSSYNYSVGIISALYDYTFGALWFHVSCQSRFLLACVMMMMLVFNLHSLFCVSYCTIVGCWHNRWL